MTYSPKTLNQLGAYWTSQGGVNLGVVGDVNHRVGYHLGRDRIYGHFGQGDDDYSVKHPRDRKGLTDGASAIDLGKLDGTYEGLQGFSRWLVKMCMMSATGSRDVREIIYSPDGVRVQRYSGIDGQIHTGEGNGDASHTKHTHISYFRDAENRDKRPLFRPYFAPVPEDDMLTFTLSRETEDVVVTIDGAAAIRLDDGELIPVHRDEIKQAMAFGRLSKPYGTGSGAQADRQSGFLLFGTRPAWLLAYAAKELPATGGGDVTHTLTVNVDGVTVHEQKV